MSTNERDLIVGGQAVIEGVMMRTPNAYAIAVRKPDGTIVNTSAVLPKWSDKLPILKLPVLRGGAVLLQSMGLGIKALNYSASEAFAEVEAANAAEVKIALTPAVIEGEGDTYSAHVPDLPVIVAAADTRAEVVRLIQEAVPLYIETLRQRGEPIPPPTTTALTIPVPAA